MPIDYRAAAALLDSLFREVESQLLSGNMPTAPAETEKAFDTIFASTTQAFRETLLGCCIARLQDKSINVRLPYVNQGVHAFNGRTLDERVVNPFLLRNRIPSSRGPYLGVFRRSVRLDESTRRGIRDKAGYDALLELLSVLESTREDQKLSEFCHYLLFRFAQLRESHSIPLSRLQRISLEQYDLLLAGLLAIPSGGRIPVMLVLATFFAIKEFFGLDWEIEHQGINVADAAGGAGGDITISKSGRVLLAAEITERPLDHHRVAATFNTKIARAGIEDYLFFVKAAEISPEAKLTARQYFAQGHEINFVEIKSWILMCLATMGHRGRETFNTILITLVDGPDVPRSIKVGWNEQIAGLLGQLAGNVLPEACAAGLVALRRANHGPVLCVCIRSFSFSPQTYSRTSLSGIRFNPVLNVNGRV